MALLVRSVMLGMKHAAPIMMKQRSGSIINNGSIAGHQTGYSTSMIYGAAKAAVNHLTRCVAWNSASTTCASTPCRPAPSRLASWPRRWAWRPPRRKSGTETIEGIYAKAQPIPRAGIPDDIAQCVIWLASDRSTFVNATDIVVDGGVLGGTQLRRTTRASSTSRRRWASEGANPPDPMPFRRLPR